MHTFVAKKTLYRKIIKQIANIFTPSCHDYGKWERKNKWLRRAGVKIGENVAIDQGFFCLTGLEKNILIEDYTVIGVGLRVWSFNEIHVGKFCMFAADVGLVNGSHDRNTFEPCSGSLSIGNGCWIGHGAKIIGSLTVGDNAIVGAGSLVLKDVPAGAIVAGVPAKIIGQRDLPDKVWHLGGEYFCPRTFILIKDI